MKIDPKVKDEVLLFIEKTLEKLVEAKADELADKAIEALKQAVPDWADAMLESSRTKFKQHFKAFLLAQVDQISGLDDMPPPVEPGA